jgi:cytosolic carboxypeptidase protein 2/3
VPPDQEYKYLYFDSDFESGNLDLVIKCHKTESYDVFLRPDTNTSGYFQWFYFRVRNRCKGTKIRINIVNMTKRNSLYQQGMPVQVLSLQKARETGCVWGFGGQNIKYGVSKLMGQPEEGVKQRLYFQLGWDYTFEYDHDEVFFAYSLPYTFSMVSNMVNQITEKQQKMI